MLPASAGQGARQKSSIRLLDVCFFLFTFRAGLEPGTGAVSRKTVAAEAEIRRKFLIKYFASVSCSCLRGTQLALLLDAGFAVFGFRVPPQEKCAITSIKVNKLQKHTREVAHTSFFLLVFCAVPAAGARASEVPETWLLLLLQGYSCCSVWNNQDV